MKKKFKLLSLFIAFISIGVLGGVASNLFDNKTPLETQAATPENFYIELDRGSDSDSATIGIAVVGSPSTTPIVKWSYDKSTWNDFEIGTTSVTLDSSNKRCYFKGTSSTVWSSSTSNYRSFNISTTDGEFVNVGGTLASLINNTSSFYSGNYAFCYLFKNCAKLKDASNLELARSTCEGTYSHMFYGCTNLVSAPRELPNSSSTYVVVNYFEYMFYNCSSLENGPTKLEALEARNYCYRYMFFGCSKLKTAPILYFKSSATQTCNYMFYNCSSLNYIELVNYTGNFGTASYNSWVSGVSSTGTFKYDGTCTTVGSSFIPSGWTVPEYIDEIPLVKQNGTGDTDTIFTTRHYGKQFIQSDYQSISIPTRNGHQFLGYYDDADNQIYDENGITTYTDISHSAPKKFSYLFAKWTNEEPVYIELASGTTSADIKIVKYSSPYNASFQYSFDNVNWNDYTAGTNITLDNNNPKCFFKNLLNNGLSMSSNDFYYFDFTNFVNVGGNILSLTNYLIPNKNFTFWQLFCNHNSISTKNAYIKDSSKLILPEYLAAGSAYLSGMFYYQGAMEKTISKLPATILGTSCYSAMFYYCTSLKEAPFVLPASTLTNSCYNAMFANCSKLISAPVVLATTLADRCFYQMFYSCSSLSEIRLAYSGSFSGEDVPNQAFNMWVSYVKSTGSFYYNGTDRTYGSNAIPKSTSQKWNILPFVLKTAEDIAKEFNEGMSGTSGACDFQGIDTNKTSLSLIWQESSNDYNLLSNTEKAKFINPTITAIIVMVEKYDYIYGKYADSLSLDNFLQRDVTQNASRKNLFTIKDIDDSTWIITVVSIIGISAVGAYFFYRKRKEE